MKTDLEYMTDARAMIEHGWCQYEATRGERVCAAAAIMKVLGISIGFQYSNSDANKMYVHLIGTLASALPDNRTNWGIISFNDHPDTTKADVLALYDRAITKLMDDQDYKHHLEIAKGPKQMTCGCCTNACMCADHAPNGVAWVCDYHVISDRLDASMRREFECRCEADACP